MIPPHSGEYENQDACPSACPAMFAATPANARREFAGASSLTLRIMWNETKDERSTRRAGGCKTVGRGPVVDTGLIHRS